MKAVGARLPRYDGIEHVTGRTTYVDDVRVAGTLWVKALRSPVHSATMSELDLEPSFHQQVAYKASWHKIGDDAPQFDEMPPA